MIFNYWRYTDSKFNDSFSINWKKGFRSVTSRGNHWIKVNVWHIWLCTTTDKIMSGDMRQTWRYPRGLTEALQSTPCKPDTFCICVREVTTYIESQIKVLKQSIPLLPFSQDDTLGTRLRRGPPSWLRCRAVAVKRLGTILPPDHRKLQISERTKTS